ncbi:MAG: TetR/AcrR family transcriptional regulator [Raoultibacter sp.]
MLTDLTQESSVFDTPEIRTKMNILHAVTKSLDKITVSEICENAGISRQTFYRHFESKFDIPWWHSIFCRQFYLDEIGRTISMETGYYHHLRLIAQEEAFYRRSLQYSINTPYGHTVLPDHRKNVILKTLRQCRGIEPNANMMFLIENFSKTETEVINDWYRSDKPVDLATWTDNLVSLVPHRLYVALQLPEMVDVYQEKLSYPATKTIKR